MNMIVGDRTLISFKFGCQHCVKIYLYIVKLCFNETVANFQKILFTLKLFQTRLLSTNYLRYILLFLLHVFIFISCFPVLHITSFNKKVFHSAGCLAVSSSSMTAILQQNILPSCEFRKKFHGIYCYGICRYFMHLFLVYYNETN